MSFFTRAIPRLMPLVFTAALVVAVPVSAQASVTNPTSKSVLRAAASELLKQSGVHLKVFSLNGTSSNTVVVDIGTGSGMETITSGTKKVVIIVTPTDAYLSGSATGLTAIMGLTAAQQKKVGTLSIVMKAGTSPYENFKKNLTISVLSAILPVGKETTFRVSSDKKKDYQLTWKTNATVSAAATKSVLLISSGSKTLPVKETISGSAGGGTTTFSKWGEHVTETAPAASATIPYAKVVTG